MSARLLCRVLVNPDGKRKNLRPSATVRDAVRIALKREIGPGDNAESLWASLKAVGWQVLDVPEPELGCAAPGCPDFGIYGFGAVKTCRAHRELGEAQLQPPPLRDPDQVREPEPTCAENAQVAPPSQHTVTVHARKVGKTEAMRQARGKRTADGQGGLF